MSSVKPIFASTRAPDGSVDHVDYLAGDGTRLHPRPIVCRGTHADVVVDVAPSAIVSASVPGQADEVQGVVEFYPEGLLHKFGFGDGDMLYELIEEHDLGVDHQDLLIAVVEQLVVPRLDQVVETYTMVSLHNPIRASTIDGEEADVSSTLTPQIVEIPVADIIRIARTLPPRDDEGY